MTSISRHPGRKEGSMEGREHRLRELELLEVIANQGLEIAHLKGQVSRVQLEKILAERKVLLEGEQEPKLREAK